MSVAEVRAFESKHAESVATLFDRIFCKTGGGAPDWLVQYINEIYLEHPWSNADIPSLVYIRPGGEVAGFIGVFPVPITFRGERKWAAYCGSLMVDDPGDDPLAGARLLRGFMEGRQALSLSETANSISLNMWLKAGGHVVANRSLNWVRIIRPAAWAAEVGSRRLSLLKLGRPMAAIADRFLTGMLPPLPDASAIKGEDVSPSELGNVIRNAAGAYDLHPDFDDKSLSFLLSHASTKEKLGPSLARVVFNRRGQSIGGYLGYGGPRGTFKVLQVFTRPPTANVVLNDLLVRSAEGGAVAVSGRIQPELLAPLLAQSATFFFRGGATLAASRDPELLAAVSGNDSFINGLAGETWAKLVGGLNDDL